MLTSSIVVSTYNGEKYIEEQLDSLLSQTRLPSEIVISDDCSSDTTLEVVRSYVKNHEGVVRWSVHLNERNKGFARNFIDAAKLSTGDIIFFCDQDDVWDSEKIEKMMIVFESNSDALAAHCYQRSIDAQGAEIQTAYDRYTFSGSNAPYQREDILSLLKYRRSSGLCLAFKRELLAEIDRWNVTYDVPHDLPVGFIASTRNGYYSVNEVLVNHRITGENTSNPHKSVKSRIRDTDFQMASNENALKYFDIVLQEFGDSLQANELTIARQGRSVLVESGKALSGSRGGGGH